MHVNCKIVRVSNILFVQRDLSSPRIHPHKYITTQEKKQKRNRKISSIPYKPSNAEKQTGYPTIIQFHPIPSAHALQ